MQQCGQDLYNNNTPYKADHVRILRSITRFSLGLSLICKFNVIMNMISLLIGHLFDSVWMVK